MKNGHTNIKAWRANSETPYFYFLSKFEWMVFFLPSSWFTSNFLSSLVHFLSRIKIKVKVKLRKLVDILISRAVGPNCWRETPNEFPTPRTTFLSHLWWFKFFLTFAFHLQFGLLQRPKKKLKIDMFSTLFKNHQKMSHLKCLNFRAQKFIQKERKFCVFDK